MAACRPRALAHRHPLDPPARLQTALYALYSNYESYFADWEKAGVGVPPVFIVVCQNTAISRLVYEWIAGFEREPIDDESIDEPRTFHPGALKCSAIATSMANAWRGQTRC